MRPGCPFPDRTPRVLLALAVCALWGCGGGSPPAAEEIATTGRLPVTVQSAHRGTLRAVVRATGLVKSAPGAELVVTAPQEARIVEMPKAVGDAVRRGDLLVRFEIPALTSEAAARSADVARAEARLATARAASQRVGGLFERGIAARKEVEEAARELAEAQAGLAEALVAREAAGALAGREVVRAPWSGVVAARGRNPGDLVDPGSGEILRLVDPARREVEAAVPLADLPKLATGSPARIFGPGGGAAEAATLLSRPATVDPGTGAATVRLSLTLPGGLPAGTAVEVEIDGEEHHGVLLVPAAAVVQDGTRSFVFTVEGDTAHRRLVTVGIVATGQAEIRSGLSDGARVVIQGQDALPDGATIVLATAAASGAPRP